MAIRVRLKDVLDLINSAHTIKVQYETTEELGGDVFKSTTITEIRTTMYGNPTVTVDKSLLNREVRCIFPVKDELVVYLKNEEVK
jgi:hypothetical protein